MFMFFVEFHNLKRQRNLWIFHVSALNDVSGESKSVSKTKSVPIYEIEYSLTQLTNVLPVIMLSKYVRTLISMQLVLHLNIHERDNTT